MLYDFALYKYSNSNLLQTYKVVSKIYIYMKIRQGNKMQGGHVSQTTKVA